MVKCQSKYDFSYAVVERFCFSFCGHESHMAIFCRLFKVRGRKTNKFWHDDRNMRQKLGRCVEVKRMQFLKKNSEYANSVKICILWIFYDKKGTSFSASGVILSHWPNIFFIIKSSCWSKKKIFLGAQQFYFYVSLYCKMICYDAKYKVTT